MVENTPYDSDTFGQVGLVPVGSNRVGSDWVGLHANILLRTNIYICYLAPII